MEMYAVEFLNKYRSRLTPELIVLKYRISNRDSCSGKASRRTRTTIRAETCRRARVEQCASRSQVIAEQALGRRKNETPSAVIAMEIPCSADAQLPKTNLAPQ